MDTQITLTAEQKAQLEKLGVDWQKLISVLISNLPAILTIITAIIEALQQKRPPHPVGSPE